MEKYWILVDIDGTLSDASKRAEMYLNGGTPDWDGFYATCGTDAPIETIINIVSHLCDFYDVVLCTGRRKSCENATRAWLDVNAPRLAKVPILFRNDGDKRHDTIVKPELLDKYIHDAQKHSYPMAIFEDRNSMVAKWRELGYTVLQTADGNF